MIPELPPSDAKAAALVLRQEMSKRKKEYQYLWPEEMKAYLEDEQGFDFLGSGSKRVVFAPKSRKDIVLAADFHTVISPDEAKRLYYVQKILHILFPNNFPKIYAIFGGDESDKNSVSGSIRERIYPSKNPNQEVKYPFSEVAKAREEMGLPIEKPDFYYDISNFRIADNGGEYYLDTFEVERGEDRKNPVWPKWDTDKIKEWMSNKGREPEEIDQVLNYVQKIEALRGV